MSPAPDDGEDEGTDEEGVGEVEDEEGGRGAVDDGRDGLGISAANALYNYNRAGTLVPETKPTIRMEDYSDHINPGVEDELNRLVEELDIPYKLTEFQRIGACVLGSGKSLFLTLPTGEGKLTVGLLGAHLLRRTRNQPNGVTIITQPLTRESFGKYEVHAFCHCTQSYPGLMMEQLEIPWACSAILTMSGQLTIGEEGDGQLLGSFDDLLQGKYAVVCGHPESFQTPEGQRILNELARLNLIQMVVVDEVSTSLNIPTQIVYLHPYFCCSRENKCLFSARFIPMFSGYSGPPWLQPAATSVHLPPRKLQFAS